jgi:hypothetical protein
MSTAILSPLVAGAKTNGKMHGEHKVCFIRVIKASFVEGSVTEIL